MVVLKSFSLTLCLLVVLTFCTTSVNGLKRLPNGTCPGGNYKCKDGLILPKWMPDSSLSLGDKVARAIIYFAGLAFMFLGVSIIADRFMAAIEVITSQEKLVTIKHPTGEKTTVSVRVWNETVSNLTLMALGSSTPEILLSVIEICGNNFDAGELGPGTIVGSAAFNMFMIIALCVYVVPSNENRKVKHLRVFFITSAWSLFAYIWLYIIISVSSKGQIDVWEGTFTLLCFPLTVLSAYAVDKRIFFDRFLPKKYRQSHNLVVAGEGSDVEMDKMADGKIDFLPDGVLRGMSVDESNEVREFEQHRREYIRVLRDLRKKHPDLDMDSLETMANFEIMNQGPKSRAFYRIQATRKLTGGGNILSKKRLEAIEQDQKTKEVKVVAEDTHITKIFFNPGHYTVFENVGTMFVNVTRQGGNENNTVYVDYSTADGTANAGSDYDHVEGTLMFKPGETEKSIAINIVDDDIFEEDEHFYVNLSNINVCDQNGVFISTDQIYQYTKLSTPFVATIMILDDDHSGLFTFESDKLDVVESTGEVRIRVCRNSGGRGRVRIFYRAIDGTAKKERDYNIFGHELIFDNDQTEAFISIGVVDDEEYEKNEVFYIELLEPHLLDNDSDSGAEVGGKMEEEMTEAEKIAEMGKPRLGDIPRLTVHIKESKEFRNTVDKLVKKSNLSNLLGTSSWTEQFREALTVSAGDEDDDDDDETAESRLPSCFDYVMHFLTVFWKVLFALVPPTDYWGGWLCFSVSMIVIGLLTAVIGDLASHFGCTIGLRDSVTAISFVALGTSVPDTFASKVAAIGDQYADSSIGNVTGSNAVNVFLGIGIAWSLAAIYHKIKGDGPFVVKTGTIAFSVTVFCVFALVCIIVLLLRRHKSVGGELGGPKKYKVPTTLLFCTLWVTYVVISSLEAYCHIEGF